MASSNENSPERRRLFFPHNDDKRFWGRRGRQLKEREDERIYRAKLRQKIVKLSKNEEVKKVATVVDLVSDDDDDDIAHDPEIRAMWKRGEHTCVMFDAPCAVCEKDDEEDEEFKRWGQPKGSDPDGMPGGGIPGMTQSGAQLAFARLTPDSEGKRTIEDVNVLASQWSTLLRSGGMSEQVYAVDVTTILMSIPDSRLMGEVREFLWLQPDVESFEWNSQMWMKGDKKPRARPPPRNLKKENGDKEKAEKRKRQKRLAKKRKRETKEGKGGGEEL